jgi:hypothetical protein
MILNLICRVSVRGDPGRVADLPSPVPVAAVFATLTSSSFAYHDFGLTSFSFVNGNIWPHGFRASGQLTWGLVHCRYLAELPGLGLSWI